MHFVLDMATRVKELCDICYNQHITSEAIIFCSKCDEKLCERCRANHSVARLSRKHECITLENFSKLPKFVQNTKLYCKTHDERYEYYCFEHDEPCCISCFNGVHSKCPYMSSLQNVVKNIKFSQEFCDLQRKILDLIHNISKVIADRRENLQELKNQKIKCRQAIRSARATVNAILDKMEHEITMKMYKEFAEKESDIENLLEIFERYFSIINKSKECLDTIKSFATDFQALLGARQISIDANCVHKATRKVFKGKHLTHVKISMKPTALSLIKSKLNSLGTLNVKYFSRRLSYEARWIGYAAITMKSPDIQLKAKFSVTIPGFEGTEKLNISGCCILKNGDILISDGIYHRLLILNNNGDLRNQVNLTFIPLRTVYLNSAQIIIAPYNEKRLYIFDVEKDEISKTMAYDETLPLKLISMKDNDILGQHDSHGFCLLYSNGDVDSNSKSKVFDSDLHEVVCINDHIYYVANDGICCCDMQGDEIWKFQHLQLRKPYALTSNGSNILITTDYQTGYVFAIGTDGKSFKIFYADERLRHVNSMNYDYSNKKLLMVTEKGTVLMYDVASKNN